jgi:chromate transport protein ChrA
MDWGGLLIAAGIGGGAMLAAVVEDELGFPIAAAIVALLAIAFGTKTLPYGLVIIGSGLLVWYVGYLVKREPREKPPEPFPRTQQELRRYHAADKEVRQRTKEAEERVKQTVRRTRHRWR